ncbi:MAG TPA: hypothetical protein VNV41_16450 [Candidatus Acidoferrales bacterium]|jgi:hypothetical protein|nr:hypothetical protein [Candidatus Acidoferrales bacterium]
MPIKFSDAKAVMTLDELKLTPEYQLLAPKMQMFVASYVQHFVDLGSFDPTWAVQNSYECSTPEHSRIFGYQLLSNGKVIAALNTFFGVSPEEAFRAAVAKAVHNRRLTNSQIRALELQCRINGWSSAGLPNSRGREVAEPEPEAVAAPIIQSNVGDIVVQAGVKYRVTSVDAAGKPLTADEVEE